MLLGLDLLDAVGLYADKVDKILVSKALGFSMPLVRKYGHMYLVWAPATILFTKAELKKLHRQFKHPSAEKLMNLLKSSKLKDLDENTRKMLEEISRSYAKRATFFHVHLSASKSLLLLTR